MPVNDPANWHVVLEKDIVFPYGKGFKHFHTAQVDPYTGLVYFSSGDDNTSSALWCSHDGGTTFTQLGEYDRKRWRMLNMAFTADYIYWASDDWGKNHALWRARRGADGALDVNSLEELENFYLMDRESVIKGNPALATYATVYMPRYNALLLLDRDDGDGNHGAMDVRIFDLENGTCHVAAKVYPLPGNTTTWGFRCETVTTCPQGDDIVVSFGRNYPNRMTVAGNLSSSVFYQVNTLVLHVSKSQSSYNVEFRKL